MSAATQRGRRNSKISRLLASAAAKSLLREAGGPLTQDLVQRPGEFGLGHVPARLVPDATTTLVCGFCSTGCGLNVHLREGRAINLSPAPDHPVNLGMACPKGWEALTPLTAPDRATTPLLRNPKTGALEQVDWDHALQVFTLRFKALLDQHGPESVAWLGTGQMPTEELAFLGALGKFGMGLRHGDSNTRQCMATSAVAYKQSFGFDAPPYTYADFEESDVLVFIGSNLCIAHPILWQRVLRNRKQPQIVVIDPRKTETAMAATQHLAIAPKSDLVLLYGTARSLIARGAVHRDFVAAHTAGFADFASFVQPFTAKEVCAATGLSAEAFDRFVVTIARGKAVSFWWTMGVNQGHESTRTAQAIINLALMTGNIGRPGTGANSVTGQCNAMGSRLFSNTTNLLGGHDFTNAEHRRKLAHALRIPVEVIPATNSWAYDQILHGIADGKVKGLWIIATNPAHSWIGKGGQALKRAERGTSSAASTLQPFNASTKLDGLLRELKFLVVQDMYANTDTAKLAHLVLPAAGWGEKEGTFINSERRLGCLKKVAPAPGQALADFHIFRLIAHYWGCGGLFGEWTSPQAVFQILKGCSAGQPCDITGIEDFRMIEACGGVQWPWAASDAEELKRSAVAGFRAATATTPPSTIERFNASTDDLSQLPTSLSPQCERRLFGNGKFFTPDGKARFIFEEPLPLPEPIDAEYPFILLTGRGTSAQWHTETRTGKSVILRRLSSRIPRVEIHPSDAARLRIRAKAPVRLSSRRGSVVVEAFITATVQSGQVYLPMHYGETNQLTLPVFDPYSRQPGYKFCAVRLERADERSTYYEHGCT
jgi:assimilatory nitrate reductase catalytic subunit